MSRPKIQGLEYFPFDSDIFSDRKIKRLLRTFGTKGFTVYTFLLCEIYRDKGYYMMWDDNAAFDVSDAVVGTSEELVKNVVNGCFEWDLFNKSMYEKYGVLTSKGIQKRYLEVTKRRTCNIEKYLIPETGTKVSVTGTKVSATETPGNGTESPQTKENKTKENKRYPYQDIVGLWNSTCCPPCQKVLKLTQARKDKIRTRIEEMGGETSGINTLQAILSRVKQSDFLGGGNKHGWKASFDWLFENEKNWVKVLEGNYGAKQTDPQKQKIDFINNW